MKLQPEISQYCEKVCLDRDETECPIPSKATWVKLNLRAKLDGVLDGKSGIGMRTGVGDTLQPGDNERLAVQSRDNVAIDIAACVTRHMRDDEFTQIVEG